MKYIIALDQGTTSSRAILFNEECELLSKSQKEIMQFYPQTTWVEEDPQEIWASTFGVMQELLALSEVDLDDIKAIGITNQRETTILWDKKTGQALYPAIVWQDRRGASRCDKMKQDGLEAMVKAKTGLVIDAYFSATKLAWLLDELDPDRKRAKNGELLFGTVDTWLLWKLTGGKVHKTDYTNASRTMLFDINTLSWDDELLNYFNIPREVLPEVFPSSHIFGHWQYEGREIPISGIAGDQQAALFGQMGLEKGDVKNTYGTGCFMLMNTGQDLVHSKSGLLTTLLASLDEKPTYALEGAIFIGGAVIQWLRDELKFIDEASDSAFFAEKIKSNEGVYIVPAFVGLGAPYWDMYAKGAIYGLTRATSRSHLIRASLESIAYQTLDVLKAMENDTALSLTKLNVDGGAASNDFLMQFQADIAKMSVVRPRVTETTALGAAYLAGLGVGVWESIETLKEKHKVDNIFFAEKDDFWREENYSGWQKALMRTLENKN